MSNVISHKGILDSIEGGVAHVRITQHSACSCCKVASYCNSAESKEKLIDARVSEPSRYHVGDEVTVMAAQSVGTKAVILAFVIPLILMMSTIATVVRATGNEMWAAVSGIAILVPYYALLYMLRNRLARQLTFYLDEQNTTV